MASRNFPNEWTGLSDEAEFGTYGRFRIIRLRYSCPVIYRGRGSLVLLKLVGPSTHDVEMINAADVARDKLRDKTASY